MFDQGAFLPPPQHTHTHTHTTVRILESRKWAAVRVDLLGEIRRPMKRSHFGASRQATATQPKNQANLLAQAELAAKMHALQLVAGHPAPPWLYRGARRVDREANGIAPCGTDGHLPRAAHTRSGVNEDGLAHQATCRPAVVPTETLRRSTAQNPHRAETMWSEEPRYLPASRVSANSRKVYPW